MIENSKYWFENCLKSKITLILYIKYWLWGSFISFTLGWVVVIFVNFLDYLHLDAPRNGNIIICFGPFVGALIIKLIKKDIPWFIYSTTGLIFVITFMYFAIYVCTFLDSIMIYNYNITFVLYGMLDMYKEKPIHHDATLMLGVIVLGFFASFLGGFIVDIYRYLKHKYSKNISSHIGSKERI